MKIFIHVTVLLFISAPCLAQKQNVYYLKNSGQEVALRDSADFVRIIREPDSSSKHFILMEYYPNGAQKRLGHTSTLGRITLEGQVADYFPTGRTKRVATYEKGSPAGDVFDRYPSGKPYRTLQYYLIDEEPSQKNRPVNRWRTRTMRFSDSAGHVLVQAGNGTCREYNDDFSEIVAEGAVRQGLKHGEWKGYKKGKPYYVEQFDSGELISGISYDSLDTKYSYKGEGETQPTFATGMKSMGSFIRDNYKVPSSVAGKFKGLMRLEIGFVIEKDGSLSGIVPHNISVPKELNDEAIRVFKKSPKWTPGMQHGQPVRVAYTLPVSITLQ